MPSGKYQNFYKTSLFKTVLRMAACAPLALVTQIPPFLMPKIIGLVAFIIGKMVLPTIMGNIYIFSMNKYIGFKFGLINTEVAKEIKIKKDK